MIGKNITNLRRQRGYSLSELADLASISKSYLSSIERNISKNPSIHIIEKIAKILKVDLITLLKTGTELDNHLLTEEDWDEFLKDLKELGIKKDRLEHYKTLIEFIKWQNEQTIQERDVLL
ncbi:helix-turn-helix transcriptional regulator [Bacillus luteolus]|uniref:Helix-turn-helix transcriptional regulator n=1 Tax=Litchfieldia luteola TaxID=682179 RepID=A0ABR9QFH2_9BACI|nr:helix-turn-helix transcriptional regulator [Cytobacillus luteolus]MBE4907239.1 helix-turn-helix transcriptional regulator [Cytobacillus luteolus]MBP1943285.1 XRE family transcriptional regulator of biofilm formation [Cytobacillus luteolus]